MTELSFSAKPSFGKCVTMIIPKNGDGIDQLSFKLYYLNYHMDIFTMNFAFMI